MHIPKGAGYRIDREIRRDGGDELLGLTHWASYLRLVNTKSSVIVSEGSALAGGVGYCAIAGIGSDNAAPKLACVGPVFVAQCL